MRDTDTDVQAGRCRAGEATSSSNIPVALRAARNRFLAGAALIGALLAAGCQQDTAAVTAQPARQIQDTPAANTTGAGGYTAITNNYYLGSPGAEPADTAHQLAALTAPGDEGDAELSSTSAGSGETQTKVGKARGRNIVVIAQNYTTGGNSTPQTVSPAYTSTASPQSNTTQSPAQPTEVSTSVPIAVGAGPGSAANASGASGTGHSTQTLTNEQQAELRTLQALADQGGAVGQAARELLLARMAEWFGGAAASQPAP